MTMTTVTIKVIAAEGEHKASRALKHAAEVIADSPAALQVSSWSSWLSSPSSSSLKSSYFQLRYLQTLNSISAENNSTIIFPVPIDVMSQVAILDDMLEWSFANLIKIIYSSY